MMCLLETGRSAGFSRKRESLWGDEEYIIVGIGINLNMSLEEALLIDKPATSVYIESGKRVGQAGGAGGVATVYFGFALDSGMNPDFPGIRARSGSVSPGSWGRRWRWTIPGILSREF